MKHIKTYVVDAFTAEPFKGNPAGVCLLEQTIDDLLMQLIATELNYSETAFVVKQNNGQYFIRYFSPKTEIPFCGHATLSAAKVLIEEYSEETSTFLTGKGLKLITRKKNDEIVMEFPLYDTVPFNIETPVKNALGINEVANVRFAEATNMVLVELNDVELLKNLTPDFKALTQSISGIDGIIVTAGSTNNGFDFYSRYFWPWVGTNEDPVTGAAHTVLAKYWANKLDKKTLKAYQASERGGYMDLTLLENNKLEVTSKATIMFEGIFRLS